MKAFLRTIITAVLRPLLKNARGRGGFPHRQVMVLTKQIGLRGFIASYESKHFRYPENAEIYGRYSLRVE